MLTVWPDLHIGKAVVDADLNSLASYGIDVLVKAEVEKPLPIRLTPLALARSSTLAHFASSFAHPDFLQPVY